MARGDPSALRPDASVLHDLRTLWPYARFALRPPKPPAPRAWSTELRDPDVGCVRLTGQLREADDADECVLIVHGLGGSTESHYVLHGTAVAARFGLSSLALALRGSDRRGEDFYNVALHADLAAAVGSPELSRYARLYVLGYSMGGYVALHFARHCTDPRLVAVATLCTPIDLKAAQVYIDSRRAWIYRHHCLQGLKSIYDAVVRANPERAPSANPRVQAVKTIWDWDDLAIAPRYGYASPEDYYEALTLRRHIGSFRVPALLVASREDPIIPPRTIEPFLDAACHPREHGLDVRWTARGGHVAFARDIDLGFGPEKGIEAQLFQWFRRQP